VAGEVLDAAGDGQAAGAGKGAGERILRCGDLQRLGTQIDRAAAPQALDAGAGAGHARDVERSVGDDLAGTCDRACTRKGERARLNPGGAGEAVAGGEGENAASDLR